MKKNMMKQIKTTMKKHMAPTIVITMMIMMMITAMLMIMMSMARGVRSEAVSGIASESKTRRRERSADPISHHSCRNSFPISLYVHQYSPTISPLCPLHPATRNQCIIVTPSADLLAIMYHI